MKKLFTIIIILTAIMANAQKTSVGIIYGVSSKNNLNIGIDIKGIQSKWGFYFISQGTGVPYTGETGIDYSDICDQTEVTDNGVISKEVWGMTVGGSYNIGFKDGKRSMFNIYGGIGFAEYSEISEIYYYYKWLNSPELNEGQLVTYVSKSTFMPAIELMMNIDFIQKGPVRLGILGGFNSASYLMGLGYVAFAI